MSSVAATLRSEIRRLARKEIKAHLNPIKKCIASYRREMSAIKKALVQQDRKLRYLGSHLRS
jgi:hypothetical protein